MASTAQLRLERRLNDIERRLDNLENGGKVIPVESEGSEILTWQKNLMENENETKTNDTTNKENENVGAGESTDGGNAPSRPQGVEQGASSRKGRKHYQKV